MSRRAEGAFVTSPLEKLEAMAGLACDRSLTLSELRVGIRLLDHLNTKTGEVRPSRETLAAALGLDESSIRKAVNGLERRGYLTANRGTGRGRATRYMLDLGAMIAVRTPLSGLEREAATSPFSDQKEAAAPPFTTETAAPTPRKGGGYASEREAAAPPEQVNLTRESNKGFPPYPPLPVVACSALDEEGREIEVEFLGLAGEPVVQSAKPSKAEIALAFEEWWRQYPRKVSKGAARAKYERIVAKGEAATDELLGAVMRYAAAVEGKETRYIAHPTTWLNQGRWEDDPAAIVGKRSGIGGALDALRERYLDALEREASEESAPQDRPVTKPPVVHRQVRQNRPAEQGEASRAVFSTLHTAASHATLEAFAAKMADEGLSAEVEVHWFSAPDLVAELMAACLEDGTLSVEVAQALIGHRGAGELRRHVEGAGAIVRAEERARVAEAEALVGTDPVEEASIPVERRRQLVALIDRATRWLPEDERKRACDESATTARSMFGGGREDDPARFLAIWQHFEEMIGRRINAGELPENIAAGLPSWAELAREAA